MAVNYAQLGQLVANMTQGVNPNDKYAALMSDRFQAEQIAQAQRKAEKEAEKKKKGAMGGKIGSLLGTVVGVAAAPFTGGASLAIPAALAAGGSMIGSTAGQAIGGGSVDPMSVIKSGLEGGMTGLTPGLSAAAPVAAAPAAASAGAAPASITSAGIPSAMGIPSVADTLTAGAKGIAPVAGAVSRQSPILDAVQAAAPAIMGGAGYLNQQGNISGPPPAPPQQTYMHPSQAMSGTDFSGMSGREINRYAQNEPGAMVQMQNYLRQGGELTPLQQIRMGKPMREGLQAQGYELASRGGLIRGALRGAFAPMLSRSRFAAGPDGNLYYQGGQ